MSKAMVLVQQGLMLTSKGLDEKETAKAGKNRAQSHLELVARILNDTCSSTTFLHQAIHKTLVVASGLSAKDPARKPQGLVKSNFEVKALTLNV